jgi:AcrR family transcriptional regulator
MEADKKTKILEAALQLFVEAGFHGTPTSKIAQTAGVANGTLFHYFPTKDELIVALYLDIKARMGTYITEQAKAETSLKAGLKGQYLASLHWALNNRDEFRFVEQFSNSPYHSMVDAETLEKQMKGHLSLLRKGIKEKVIKPIPVELIQVLLSSHVYGVNRYLLSQKMSKAKQHQVISDSFELLWDMLS